MESVKNLEAILSELENSYYDFEKILRDKYPSVFLDNNK